MVKFHADYAQECVHVVYVEDRRCRRDLYATELKTFRDLFWGSYSGNATSDDTMLQRGSCIDVQKEYVA